MWLKKSPNFITHYPHNRVDRKKRNFDSKTILYKVTTGMGHIAKPMLVLHCYTPIS